MYIVQLILLALFNIVVYISYSVSASERSFGKNYKSDRFFVRIVTSRYSISSNFVLVRDSFT